MDYSHLSDNAKRLADRLRLEPILPTHKAYLLATVKHETAGTFLPINERGSASYLSKYWSNSRLRKALGNLFESDAQKFKGRGFVQITGRANYTKASKEVGVDLVTYPEKANDWETAYTILTLFTKKGWFTGVSLGNFLKEKETDFYNARKVINGLDRAATIETYAKEYLPLFT
jgi:predicted chitinase